MIDINILRSILTIVIFAAFVAICVWAWSKKRKTEFDEAANLPFEGDEAEQATEGESK
jgi:cytochrome c oxidase cbb3-type subunit 4